MATILAIPIFSVLLIVQTSIISRIPLLKGTADIILLVLVAWAVQTRVRTAWQWYMIAGLMVSIVSALPFGTVLISYALVVALAIVFKHRVWQIPLIAMLLITMIGTILTHGISIIALTITGYAIPISDALGRVLLPSVVLNMILAIPIFAFFSDLARWLYPDVIEI